MRLVASFLALVLALPLAAAERTDFSPISPAIAAPATSLRNLDRATVSLDAYRGRVLLVNFWATWCPPCRREMPSIERLRQALAGEPFEVIAINVGEDPDTVRAFLTQLGTPLSFPILLDPRSTTRRDWTVTGLPMTYLVDRDGRVVARAAGERAFDHPEVIAQIRALMAP